MATKEKKTVHEQLREIQAKLEAPKNQVNSFGGYKYRNCEDILAAAKPLLGDCVLLISDELVNIGDRYYVRATASLSNGEAVASVSAYAREAETKKGMDESQITGSASSYARKYALNGLFAIDDTRDADSDKPSVEAPKASPAPRPAPKADPADYGLSDKDTDDIDEVLGEAGRKCATCGQAAVYKTGKSAKTGKDWAAYFCESGERSHAEFLS